MGYAILWLSGLAACTLLVASTVALSSQYGRTFWRWFWPLFIVIILLLICTLFTFVFWLCWIFYINPRWLFPYALTFEIGFIVAAFIVLRGGLRKKDKEPTGRLWPRDRLVIAFFLFLVIASGTYFLIDLGMRGEIRRLRAEANNKVVTLLPAQLPEQLNAESLYVRAAEIFTGKSLYYHPAEKINPGKDLPDWFKYEIDDPDFDPNRPEVSLFLQKNGEVLGLLHRATALAGYNLDLSLNDILLSPMPQTFDDFARLLSLSARFKIREGDSIGAINDLTAVGRMEEQLWSCSAFTSLPYSINSIKTRVMEYVLSHATSLQGSRIKIPIQRSASIKEKNIKGLKLMEVAYLQFLTSFGLDVADTINKYEEVYRAHIGAPKSIVAQIIGRFNFTGKVATSFWRVYFAKADIESVKQEWATALKLVVMPYPEGQKHLNVWGKSYEKEPCGPFTKLYLHHIGLGYNDMVNMTDITIVTEKITEARRGLADLALATTTHWLSQSKYPTRLKDLTPLYIDEIPVDPFDGKPLKMNVLEGGLDLYSVGPNPKNLEDRTKWEVPLHFYIGKKAYEKYRLEPAKLKRAKREERRKELERKSKAEAGKRIVPRPKRKKRR